MHVATGFVPLYYEVTSNPASTQGLCDFTNDPMGEIVGYNLIHSTIISGGSTVNIGSTRTVTEPKKISMIPIFQRGISDHISTALHLNITSDQNLIL